MSLYLKSRSAYNTTRESYVLSSPNPSTLTNINSGLKISSGRDSSISLSFQAEVKSCKYDVLGNLMINEMKINSSIAFNAQNNEMTGFIRHQFNTKVMFENILNIDKKPTIGSHVTTYANQ